MRIIQLVSGDLWAGAEVQLYHMVCSMEAQSDIELTVVLLNHGQLERELKAKGITVYVFDESKLSTIKIILQLRKLVTRFKPHVIHTHRNKENIIGGFISVIYGCKSVRTVHGVYEYKGGTFYSKRRIFALLDKLAGRFLQQRIIAVSEELKSKLEVDFPVSKLAVINNSINAAHIENNANKNVNISKKENDIYVCFVGRFVPVKRVDKFYNLAKAIVEYKSGLNIHFYMIGDGPLWNEINERVNADKLESKIHLTGFVENTAPYIKVMDLLVFTSDNEGLPMTLLEAMVLGVPVLAGKELITIKQVLCEGKCGFIEDTNNISTLATRVCNILTNQDDMLEKSKLARSKVYDTYLIDSNVKHYIELYKGLLQK